MDLAAVVTPLAVPEPFYVCHEHYYEHLMAHLSRMDSFTDTFLVVGNGGELVSAHSLLMTALSGYLSALPQPLHPSRSVSCVLLKDLDPWLVRSLLEYFYCGSLTLPKHMLPALKRSLSILDISLGNEFLEDEESVHFTLSQAMKFSVIDKMWSYRSHNFDVKILTEGMQETYAHSAILSVCSDQLFTLFRAQGNNCKPALIVLLDFKLEDVETVLKFCYRGEVEIQRDRTLVICELARILGIKNLYSTVNSLSAPFSTARPENLNKHMRKMSCWEHKETTKKIFRTLFEKESLSDIQLICSDHTFKVHSAVLNSSPFFKKLFEFSEWRHSLVFLSRLSLESVQAFVDFMYYGEVVFSGDPQEFAHAMEGLIDFSVLPVNHVEPAWPILHETQPIVEARMEAKPAIEKQQPFSAIQKEAEEQLQLYEALASLSEVEIPPVQPEPPPPVPPESCLPPPPKVATPKKTSPGRPLTYTCNTCSQVFLSRRTLKIHLSVHPETKDIKCQHCGQMFEKQSLLKVHERSHTGARPFTCDVCGKSYSRQSVLKRHKSAAHRESGPEVFECAICGRKCSRKDYLEEHIRTHSGSKPYRCEVCGKGFVGRTGLNHHRKVHDAPKKDAVCEVCGKAFTRKALWTHVKVHDKQYECATCSKKFSTPGTLKSHVAMHHENKGFSCDVCGKKFALQNHLNRHRKNVHNPSRELFPCKTCGEVLPSQVRRAAHERVHHGDATAPQLKPRKFDCGVCGRQFSSRNALLYHQRSHLGVRPHACAYCHKSFFRPDALTKHLRSHTKERPYPCTLCELRCSSKSALNQHVKRRHAVTTTQVQAPASSQECLLRDPQLVPLVLAAQQAEDQHQQQQQYLHVYVQHSDTAEQVHSF